MEGVSGISQSIILVICEYSWRLLICCWIGGCLISRWKWRCTGGRALIANHSLLRGMERFWCLMRGPHSQFSIPSYITLGVDLVILFGGGVTARIQNRE